MGIDCDVRLVDARSGVARRVRVTGEPDDTTEALVDQVRRATSVDGPLFLRGQPIRPGATLGELGLVEGAVVSGGGVTADLPRLSPNTLCLRVVGGHGAGRVFPLRRGPNRVGRGGDVDVALPDPLVSRSHASVDVDADGAAIISDVGSTNGTLLEGALVASGEPLVEGQLIQVGTTLLAFERTEVEALRVVREGTRVAVNRRFRSASPSWPEQIAFPRPTEEGDPPALNLLLTIAPGLAMGAIALFTKNPAFLLFAAISPFLGIGRAISQRRSWRRRKAKDEARDGRKLAQAEADLEAGLRQERDSRRWLAADLAQLAVHASLPGRRLWERTPADRDYLELRIGTATQPSTINVSGAQDDRNNRRDLWHVPVTVHLPTAQNLSVVGDRSVTRRVAASLLLQLAIREAPGSVKLAVVADAHRERDWGWVAWLPHSRWGDDEPFALIGSDDVSVRSRLEELRLLIRQRRDRREQDREATLLPAVVVLLDDASRLVRIGYSEILRDGPEVGIFAICLDDEQVPQHCLASVTVGKAIDDVRVDQRGREPIGGVLVDLPGPGWCDAIARTLAPFRALGDEEEIHDLPVNLRLVDLLGLPDIGAEAVQAHWRASSPSKAAVVGVTPDGSLALDLTRDGPHGLIAGTTRSGKSEFLKTLIAAFALANHPDDLQLLLIDFKNSGDYRLASRLPHVIDLSTSENLDVFARTLRLLEAEIDRRRRMFEQASTTTIEGYGTARRSRSDLAPLGRLVVLADEFAQLVMKAPEQLDKLVTVAQTGAAFGVHLILATQRPQGAVTGQIDANVALRVCFRVAKPEESNEVVNAPDAGEIAQRHAGRAVVRAHSEPLFEFQAARVGGARRGSQVDRTPLSVSLRLWTEMGRVPGLPPLVEVPDPETDLWDVVEAARQAAAREGWRGSCIPWPKPLPAAVTLDELPEVDDPLLVPFALVDDPAHQSRRLGGLRWGGGHVGIAGSPGTGRTTALRTLACAVADRFTCADSHIYLLDFGGGRLRPLADLPHIGGTAFDDWDQATRIVKELEGVVNRRHDDFSSGGFATLEHQRQSGRDPLPYVLLIIDGWQVIAEEGVRYGLPDRIAQLLAKGQSVGLQAAVAGDRTIGMGRLGRLLGERYVLRFNDVNDYASMGVGYRDVPSYTTMGRATVVGTADEAQIAEVAAGRGQDAAIRALVERVGERDQMLLSRGPRRIEPLPRRISVEEVLRRGPPAASMSTPVLLGLSGETSSVIYLDLGITAQSAFLAGPGGSGRTNALRAIGQLLIDRGVPIALVNPKCSKLSRLAGHPLVSVVVEGAEARRIDPSTLAGKARVVLIDDSEQLESDYDGHIALVTRTAGLNVVAAASADELSNGNRGWLAALKRSRTGVLFSPKSKYDGVLFGGSLPDHMVFQGPVGRGVASVAGQIDVVQFPEVADA